MAKKPSANADPSVSVAPKEKRAKRPAEVINLPLRGDILETIRKVAKVYKVPVSAFMKRFSVEVEPHLIDIAKRIVAELEAERAALANSLFAEPVVTEPEAEDEFSAEAVLGLMPTGDE